MTWPYKALQIAIGLLAILTFSCVSKRIIEQPPRSAIAQKLDAIMAKRPKAQAEPLQPLAQAVFIQPKQGLFWWEYQQYGTNTKLPYAQFNAVRASKSWVFFKVEYKTNLNSPWMVLVAKTNQPPVPIPSNLQQAFFTVSAFQD